MKTYFIKVNNKIAGPFPIEFLINTKLQETDLILLNGETEWKPAFHYPEIVGFIKSPKHVHLKQNEPFELRMPLIKEMGLDKMNLGALRLLTVISLIINGLWFLYYSWFQFFLQDILSPDPYHKRDGQFFFVFGYVGYDNPRIFLIILYLIDLTIISSLLYLLFWLPVKVVFWISQGFRQK